MRSAGPEHAERSESCTRPVTSAWIVRFLAAAQMHQSASMAVHVLHHDVLQQLQLERQGQGGSRIAAWRLSCLLVSLGSISTSVV